MYPLKLPSPLGLEGSGIITQIGSMVKDFKVGDKVSYAGAPIGSYSTHRNYQTKNLVKVPDDIDLEINISCPNIQHFTNYTKGIENFLSTKRKVIAKLAPNTEIATVGALLDLGFTSFHCCNTLPTEHGGMSGKKLRPYVVNLCTVIQALSPNAEIIAGGGIYEKHDIIHYKNFGATSYSLGTVCFHPIKFYKLLREIREL